MVVNWNEEGIQDRNRVVFTLQNIFTGAFFMNAQCLISNILSSKAPDCSI